jgi:hypothetical protein
VTAPVADARCHARAAPTSSQRTAWLVALGIALACVVVFANALPNAFVLDDQFRVVNNPGIQRFWPPWRHFTEPRTMSTLENITQYRPLLPLTLSMNYAVSGDSGVGYHLGNLALQIAASLLGFFLCIELLSHWSAVPLARSAVLVSAGFAALLFAVHPVSGIAVNYISARDLLLMQVFFLGMLLAYARMRRLGETAARWAVVIALLALSLLAKTNLVVAPLILLAFDLILARSTVRDRHLWRRAGLAAGVVGAFFVVTQLALGFSDLAQVTQAEASPLQYGLTQARLHLFHYLPHFVWPFPIRLLPSIDPGRVSDYRVWLGLLFVVAAVGLAWHYRRPAPIVAFCVIAYWILMIPESSVLPLYQAAVDYRPYAGSLFLFLAVATVLVAVCGEGLAALVLAGFSVYIGAASIAANAHWRTAERLWSHSVAYGGDAVAHLNLAMSIADRRDPRVRAGSGIAAASPSYAPRTSTRILQLELAKPPPVSNAVYGRASRHRGRSRTRLASRIGVSAARARRRPRRRAPRKSIPTTCATRTRRRATRRRCRTGPRRCVWPNWCGNATPTTRRSPSYTALRCRWSAAHKRRSTSTRNFCARIPSTRRRP